MSYPGPLCRSYNTQQDIANALHELADRVASGETYIEKIEEVYTAPSTIDVTQLRDIAKRFIPSSEPASGRLEILWLIGKRKDA